jgi:hypothetical protein
MVVHNSVNTGPSGVHAEYKFGGSFFHDVTKGKSITDTLNKFVPGATKNLTFYDNYSIPLSSVKGQVATTEKIINDTKKSIEDFFLKKLFINPYIDPDLNDAHMRLWKEAAPYMDIPATKTNDTITVAQNTLPPYICYDEYVFAEKFASTACRELISEFDEAISQSTFSYFYQFRKLLQYLSNEIRYIKSILFYNFGADYESESQQKIALRFDTWAKMALHYTRRIASTILSKPGEIPNAEVDQVSKKQAAKFQAFFTVRLNAVDEEINNLLSSLKRDLVDESEIFYNRYVSNSIKLTKDISEPLDLEFQTTNFRKQFPNLSEEVVAASTVFSGNFSSVHADIVERYEMMISKVDAVFMFIHEKRKYANYLSQLAEKSVSKKKILVNVEDDNFSGLFRSVAVNPNRNNSFGASHGDLDDLEEDWHPQYLLKSGGTITGNIDIADGVTVAGILLKDHAHNGNDGSAKISSIDIDYDTPRQNNGSGVYAQAPLNVTIDGFISDIIDGGIPVFDLIVSIETDDAVNQSYEYEIIYTEIES